jgi:3-hydroxybutyryl-CoA dehydrogenase
MNILVIGRPANLKECEEKFGPHHQYILAPEHRDAEKLVDSHDVIFDFIIDEEPYQFEIYTNKAVTVFLNTAKITLGQLLHQFLPGLKGKFFGFNGLPTFLQTPVLEASVFQDSDTDALKNLCDKLGTDFSIVSDRVGFVTPRVISMIINEAYYTVQERTASREDVDMAMKLGTNYPWGPFEWCRRIGVKHIYELLEALFEDTKDDRYKVCPLLKREYLESQEADN